MAEPTETPPRPALQPLTVTYKKHSTKPPATASLEGDRPAIRFRATPTQEGAPPDESNDSILHIPTPLTSSIRNRSGNEFTLVFKYRLAAESPEQKEAWFQQLAALGIHVSTDDEETSTLTKKDKEGKSRRSTTKRSRTESADTEPLRSTSPGIFLRGGDTETQPRPKSTNKISSDSLPRPESPLSSPRSPSSRKGRQSSPRLHSPLPFRRGIESSPPSTFEPITGDAMPSASPSSSMSPRESLLGSSTHSSTPAAISPSFLEPELEGTPPRLIRVHGARNNVHCSLVPRVVQSLNKNDCFILDDGSGSIYTWKGKAANMFAKSECSDVAMAINQAWHGGKAKVISIQQGIETPSFWEQLSSGKGEVAEADTTGITSVAKLFKIPLDTTNGAVGDFVQVEEGRQQIRLSTVADAAAFALDTGFEIIIMDATKEANGESISEQAYVDSARRYKKEKNRPIDVRVSLIRHNPKHALFTHFVN